MNKTVTVSTPCPLCNGQTFQAKETTNGLEYKCLAGCGATIRLQAWAFDQEEPEWINMELL